MSITSNYYIGAAGDWGSARNDNWKNTVDLMINNKVNLALGLGDYSYGTVDQFKPVVDALKAAGISFKGVQGNHVWLTGEWFNQLIICSEVNKSVFWFIVKATIILLELKGLLKISQIIV